MSYQCNEQVSALYVALRWLMYMYANTFDTDTMFSGFAKMQEVMSIVGAALSNRFRVEVKGGAACTWHAYQFLHQHPSMHDCLQRLMMLNVTDLDVEVQGTAAQKQNFVQGLQNVAQGLSELLEPDAEALAGPLKRLGRSTRLHQADAGKCYNGAADIRPIPLEKPSFICPTLNGYIVDSCTGANCNLARICVAAANLSRQYTTMLPIIDIVWQVDESVSSGGCMIRSVAQLFADNVRMTFAETDHQPWRGDRPEKAAKRMRRVFGLLLILHPEKLRRRLYRRAQRLTSAIAEILLAEQERQCTVQSKLQYLLDGSSSVSNTKPLETLHKKRARGPLRILIGNIRTCLDSAPHPGTAASAGYMEWLELLSSCCFEYEHGLSILC